MEAPTKGKVIVKFTEEDLDALYHKSYLINILNGDYELAEARNDLRGLIGSKFDHREPTATKGR